MPSAVYCKPLMIARVAPLPSSAARHLGAVIGQGPAGASDRHQTHHHPTYAAEASGGTFTARAVTPPPPPEPLSDGLMVNRLRRGHTGTGQACRRTHTPIAERDNIVERLPFSYGRRFRTHHVTVNTQNLQEISTK